MITFTSGDVALAAADPFPVGPGGAAGQLGALLGLPLSQRHGLPRRNVRHKVGKKCLVIFNC